MKFKLSSYWNLGSDFTIFAEKLCEAGFNVCDIVPFHDECTVEIKDLEELVKLHRIVGNIAIQSYRDEMIELYCFEGGYID